MKCVVCFLFLFMCCMYDTAAQQNTTMAPLTLQFDNVAGNDDLKLDSGIYTNTTGEKFSVQVLQYFISNIQLTGVDNKPYIIPQDSSYFFIQEADSASQYCTIYLPANEYKSLSFLVGIDSLRSASRIDQRKGVLDPSATDMYWGWNSGYIFFKMEGIAPAAPADPVGLHKFRYHIGGFGGYKTPTINNIKNIKLDLSDTIKLMLGGKANIHIKADILKLFNGSSTVSIARHYAVMFDAYSITIADNYANMFYVDDVKD